MPPADPEKRACLGVAAGVLALGALPTVARSVDTGSTIEQPELQRDADFVARAFVMRDIAASDGDQAYGAVVVKNGRIVGQAPSRVVLRGDPTAHAEMEAIRDAAQRLGSRDLSGCTLYSSSPACPMCEAAAYWAGITRQVSGRAATDGGRPVLCR